MRTFTESLEIRLDEIVKFIELTEGKEGLESLLLSENVLGATEKHKVAYESFVGKFLDSSKNVQEVIIEQSKVNVFSRVNRNVGNQKVRELLNRI